MIYGIGSWVVGLLLPSQEGYSQVTTHPPFIKGGRRKIGSDSLQYSVLFQLYRDFSNYNLSQAYSYHKDIWIKI